MAADKFHSHVSIPEDAQFRFPCYTWNDHPFKSPRKGVRFWTPFRQTGPVNYEGKFSYCLETLEDGKVKGTFHNTKDELPLFKAFTQFIQTDNEALSNEMVILFDDIYGKEIKLKLTGHLYNGQTIVEKTAYIEQFSGTGVEYFWEIGNLRCEFVIPNRWYSRKERKIVLDETKFHIVFSEKIEEGVVKYSKITSKYYMELFVVFMYETRKRGLLQFWKVELDGKIHKQETWGYVGGDQFREFSD